MLLIDTPGFDEPETHVKVSQCILDSLKLRNNMKIMFVVELDAGNVRSSNAALIQAILQETKIDPSNCGIIINKLGKTMKRRLLGEEGMISKILSRLFGKTTETSNILLVQRYEELDDVDHAITKIPDLVPFIQALPSVQIPTNLTDPISLSISLEKRRDMIEGNVLINDDPEKGKENDKIPVTGQLRKIDIFSMGHHNRFQKLILMIILYFQASAPNFEQRNGEKKHQYLTAPYSNIKTKSKKENKKHIKKLRNTDEAIDGLKPTTNEKTGMCKSEKKKTSQL